MPHSHTLYSNKTEDSIFPQKPTTTSSSTTSPAPLLPVKNKTSLSPTTSTVPTPSLITPLPQAAELNPEVKDTRVNIRLSSAQLQQLKKRAQQEGLPYQTLIASLIHRYLTGQLVDLETAKTLIPQIHQALS